MLQTRLNVFIGYQVIILADAAQMSRREGKDGVQQGRADGSALWHHASEMLERICEVETSRQMLDEVA